MVVLIRFSILAAAALFLPVAALAESNFWRARFDREYQASERRLEEFYGSMQIVEEQTGESVKRLYDCDRVLFKYQSNGDKKRTSRLDEEGNVLSATVAAPAQTFLVRREDARSQFRLQERNLLNYEEMMDMVRNSSQRLAFSPYTIFETRVSGILFSPTCQIGTVEKVGERLGSALVKVPFDVTFPKEGVRVEGWFTFLADLSWAVADYRYMVYRGEIDYSKVVRGFPVPAKVKIWREDADYIWRLSVAKEVILEPAPDSEFTLAAFGIPESAAPSPATSRRRFWFVVSANFVAAGGLLLFFWFRRRSKSTRSARGAVAA